MDVFSPIRMIDPSLFGDNFYWFRKRYFYQAGFEWVPRPKSLKRIRKKIFTCCIRLKKEECLDLPPRVYEKRWLDLSRRQRKEYRRVKDEFELRLRDGSKLELLYVVQQFTKLLQISGGFYYTPDGPVSLDCPKLDALRALLDLPEFRNKKVVIWAAFNHEIRRIHRALKKDGIRHVLFWKHSNRNRNRRRFANDPRIKIFVGQVRLGVGINDLAVSDTAIYYSRSLRLSDRIQSEGRTHRKGSEIHKSITYIDLLTRKTVDVKVYNMLREARDVANYIMDGKRALEMLQDA